MGGVAQRLLLWNLAYIPVSDHEYTNETWFARIYSCIRGLELDCKQIPDRSASRNARPAQSARPVIRGWLSSGSRLDQWGTRFVAKPGIRTFFITNFG